MKDIISRITMKELEQIIFRVLQKSFSQVMAQILTKIDNILAEARDKKRFYLKDKRTFTFESVFGQIELKRNYYYDRVTGKYVSLLEQYLSFDGAKGLSPLVQDLAIEMAVTGVSYRQACRSLEKLLGYPVISHEGIRQQLLNTEVIPGKQVPVEQAVLFVEVDGLYTKRQGSKRKGRELKIAAVHQGWEVHGKRTKLIKKRHYIHRGNLPFWEGFEQFLMANYDVEGFMVELNSAVGTLGDEEQEKQLEDLLNQLSQYPNVLGDYRNKLKKQGIDTTGFRPMGSAEGTMSVFARRLKQGRSWSERGLDKFVDVMVALKDKLEIRTLQGYLKQTLDIHEDKKKRIQEKPPRYFIEKLKDSAQAAIRNNIPYLQHALGKPVVEALKGLKGI